MHPKEPSQLSDQELLAEVAAVKPSPIANALLVGFLIGILIFSIWKNSLGFLTLIPLFFIFRLINQSKRKQELEAELKTRNLN
jgi:hypothetical protein